MSTDVVMTWKNTHIRFSPRCHVSKWSSGEFKQGGLQTYIISLLSPFPLWEVDMLKYFYLEFWTEIINEENNVLYFFREVDGATFFHTNKQTYVWCHAVFCCMSHSSLAMSISVIGAHLIVLIELLAAGVETYEVHTWQNCQMCDDHCFALQSCFVGDADAI